MLVVDAVICVFHMYTGRTSVLNVIHEPQFEICTSVTGVKLVILGLRACQLSFLPISVCAETTALLLDAKANCAVRADGEDYLPGLNLFHPLLLWDLLSFMAQTQRLTSVSSTSSRSVCFLPPSSAASLTVFRSLSNANLLNVVV